MALIGGYSVLAKHPGRDIGGGAIGLGMNRGDFGKTSMSRGRFTHEDWEPKSGVPDGYRPPYTWVLPLTAGGLSSRNIVTGSGSFTGSGARGLAAIAALVGSGSLSGTGILIVSAVAALTGSGSVTLANLQAVLNAVAALTGSGSLSGSMTAQGFALAALTGLGTLTGTRYATGSLAADITPFTELSPENIAIAVLDGESGVETGLTVRQALRLISAAAAGELSGGATTTITIRNAVADSKDRIVATVDADGNRSVVSTDVT